MPVEEGIKFAYNYGLGIALSIFIAVTGYLILMFVLRENSKREERLAGLIEKDLTNLKEETKKAHQYHRDEHNVIINKLTEIHSEVKVGR